MPSNQWLIWIAVGMMLVPALCGAQDKTLMVRPSAEAPSIVKRALVIGVSAYEHVTPLPETANDANAFAEMLRTRFGFPKEAIIRMTDDPDTPEPLKPTYLHLRAALKTLLDGINEKSEVVIFFSGHGIRLDNRDWLIPQDGLPDDVESSCLDYDRFKQMLETRRPARALLIVDACRNLQGGKGAGGSGFGGGPAVAGSQIAELLSCQPKEVSQIGKPEDFAESVFTHFLLKGLAGDPDAATAQGVVTFDSLKLYVQSAVSQYVSSKFGESQNPDGRTTLGAMVLARASSPSRPAQPTNRHPNVDAHHPKVDAGNVETRTRLTRKHILVVTVTKGFHHPSIPVAEQTILMMGQQNGKWDTDFVRTDEEMQIKMTSNTLRKYDAVVFANTTGVLPLPDPQGFLDYIRAGHGFAAMHAASDTFHVGGQIQWPDYFQMLGGEFMMHGKPCTIDLDVDGKTWSVYDEIFLFKNIDRDNIHVLLSLGRHPDDGSPEANQPGDYLISWDKVYGMGRVFYTALGHRLEVWQDPIYQKHIEGGLLYVLGLTTGN